MSHEKNKRSQNDRSVGWGSSLEVSSPPPCLEQDSHQHQTNPALAFSSQLLEVSKDALSTTSPGTYFRAVLLSWWNNIF